MTENQNQRPKYDLEERTFQFAKDIRLFAKSITYTIINSDDLRQLIKSSGSIDANYREANNALSKKDFIMRLKISRKEAKESEYWLNLFMKQMIVMILMK